MGFTIKEARYKQAQPHNKYTYMGRLNEYDIYYYTHKEGTIYLARYSNLGWDYKYLDDYKNQIYKELEEGIILLAPITKTEKEVYLRQRTVVKLLFNNLLR